ncbi:hypothetical protein ACFYYY_16885 [Streptomyces sp. NPDC001834]|uniref:hypothetical protein n=1 Tax=unclassified Streptomyces TaxID=2593676 RepID=UPI0034344EF9
MSTFEGPPVAVAVSHLPVYDSPVGGLSGGARAERPSARGRFGMCGRLDVYSG